MALCASMRHTNFAKLRVSNLNQIEYSLARQANFAYNFAALIKL